MNYIIPKIKWLKFFVIMLNNDKLILYFKILKSI